MAWLAIGMLSLVFAINVSVHEASAAMSSLRVIMTSGISLNISSVQEEGTFASSSTANNVFVWTDNYSGYTLGIKAKVANDTALTYKENNVTVATIPSISSAVSATNYADDSYAASNHLNNTWGYKPSVLYNESNQTNEQNSNYLPAPTSATDQTVIAKTNQANQDTSNDLYNIAIGARVDTTTVPGNYSNTFVITAVANPINYTIAFDKGNTTDTVSDLPADQTGVVSDPTTGPMDVTISSTTPTRAGMTFLGWCNEMPTTNVTTGADSCSGITYAAGGNYALDTTKSGSVTLYAIWREAVTFEQAYSAANKTKYNGGSYYAMQDMTPGICEAVDIGQTETLIDIRGGTETYTVAKLKDGKCWMTENLNLAGGTALSADDTDVTSTYIGGFTNQANLTKSDNTISLPASATKNSGDNNLTDSGQFGNSSNAYVFNSGTETNCGASSQNTPCYSYYSWIAATLGGKQANGTTAQTSNGYNAAASICPKGWKLPTSTTSNANAQTSPNWKTGDWYALAKAYEANLESNYYDSSSATGKNFYNNAGPVNNSIPNFLLAGYYYNGSFFDGGSYGDYWSSTSYGSSSAYYLYFNSSGVYSASNFVRRRGFSVRCIAKSDVTTVSDLIYLQDFASLDSDTKSRVLNNMTEEQNYTLKDKRDKQSYTIAKLKDGKVWMTENLNIAGGTTLSSGDTDFTPDYTLPTTDGWTTADNGTKLVLPASSNSGFSNDSYAYVYNSNNITTSQSDCTNTKPCNSYYSWDAATLGSGRSIATDNTDAPYSICPKGWRLPTSRTTSATNWQTTSDFYMLAHQYGLDSTTSTSESDSDFYTKAGPGTTPSFLLAGNYYDGSFGYGGILGHYWSSTSRSNSSSARYLYFYSSGVNSANVSPSRYGFSVRCLAAPSS